MTSFVWDDLKAKANVRKHRVSFDEARSFFYDQHARLIADPDHSDEEDRFVIIGLSERPRLLVVCHCYRENDEIIRIVSARKATRSEALWYRRWKQ